MLNNLTLTGFKAWQELNIGFGKVTGLFGTNSSGKSSILQFLLLLKQTKNATDRGLVLDFGGPNEFVNLGAYRDIVHGHEEKTKISWIVDWTLPTPLKISDPGGKRTDVLFETEHLSAECEIEWRKTSLIANSIKYMFDGKEFELASKTRGATEYRLNASGTGTFQFVRNQGRVWALPGPLKTHLFPDQAKTYYRNSDFISGFEVEYEAMMDRLYYLGPLRDYPKREYHWAGASPQDVGIRGERTVDAILAATSQGWTRNLKPKARLKPFQEMIAYWLKELGLISEFRIERIGTDTNLYRAKVKRDRYSTEALLTDVGFGVSQVLPALVLLYYVPEGSTVLMEQPEIHLHPSVQSGLADVILTVAQTRNLQIIVESHSEHLLRRFQRRVADETASADDVKLYFVEQAKGAATLNDLRLNMFGEVENWPDHFFGDELGEIGAIKTASLRRKLESRG
jgi:predicted ATPase